MSSNRSQSCNIHTVLLSMRPHHKQAQFRTHSQQAAMRLMLRSPCSLETEQTGEDNIQVVICSWSVCSRLESPKKKHQYIKSVLLLLLILLVYDAAIVAQAPSGRRSHRCDYDHKVNLTLNANFNASCNVSIFDIASGRSSRGRTWQKARRDRQEKVETAAAAILRLDHNGK